MKIANILLDLDGTLVDSWPGIEYASQVAVRATLPGKAMPELRPYMGPPIREMFRQALQEESVEVINELERQFRASYDGEGWRRSVAYPGVAETLPRLSALGLRCFVVTNKPAMPTERILRHLSLWPYFEEVVCPDSRVPPFTTKAAAVAYLLAKYALEARQTVFIGDSEDDARTAQACALRFIAVAYGYGKAHIQRDIVPEIILLEFGLLAEFAASRMQESEGVVQAQGGRGQELPEE